MVSLFLIHLCLDFRVAFQALAIGDFIPERMTMGTVGDAFEMGMHRGKFAGGYLGKSGKARKNAQGQEKIYGFEIHFIKIHSQHRQVKPFYFTQIYTQITQK
jgi:hypothetical protein